MSCRPEYAQLCRLINDSLRPYIFESGPLLPHKDKEKDLLILLSNISRKIRRWTDEHDLDSEIIKAKVGTGSRFCQRMEQNSGDFHDCLANSVSSLVIFLNMGNQYIRHVTSNLLAVIFDFLAKSAGICDEFLHLFSVCMQVAISNVLPSSSLLFMTVITNSDGDTSGCVSFMRRRMVNTDWVTLDGLIQVMRNVLKHLKQDCAGETARLHMHSVICSIMNIPWDLLNDSHLMQTSEAHVNAGANVSHYGKNCSPVSRVLFLGTLLQLLSSMVECVFVDDGHGTVHEHPVLEKIAGLIPKLLAWCFDKQKDLACIGIFHYLRHKILMLMVRLSFHIPWECSAVVFWLHLLRKYFNDILYKPISRHCVDLNDCLEGSPFLASIVDEEEVYRICTCHLQRQIIFLFLKCSFSFVRCGKEADLKCSCATSNPLLTHDLLTGQHCYNRKKGLVDLSEWLQRHVSLDMFVDYKEYLEKCGSFRLSFLQLYMDEDDFLFDVLLQLSGFPFLAEQIEACREYNEKGKALEEVKDDIIFHLSNILNPVHLFHLFLAELHYDHLVLLDYLISEDTGIHCLQYLSRCLRTVIKSWDLFVEFPVCDGEKSSSCKSRRISVNDPVHPQKMELSLPAEKARKNAGIVDGQMLYNERKRMFKNAKECLLSLKQSIENLHQKNLFPYNPTVLMRSLNRFEELCHQR